MAEDQDDSQKTEEPTEKKLRDAREKGQVARSQEVNHWFMILSLGVILAIFAPGMMEGVSNVLQRFLEKPHLIPVDGGGLGQVLVGTLLEIVAVLLLPVLVILAAAIASGLLQTGALISAEQLKPKLEKISLIKGAKRMFGPRALVEFAKGIAKLAVVATVVFFLIWPQRDRLPMLIESGIPTLLDMLRMLGLQVVGGVLAVMTIVAGLDLMFQRYQHHKQMRMSRQELKDEYKQTEGDPQIKQKLRQLRMEKSRKRMMAAVPDADVVITNPTHYAVALAYKHGEMSAPVVVAKGLDELARRIRELAEKHDVPLVENPPLARALHAGVELDDEIPPEHYKAVAEIIGYVMRLKGRVP